MWRRACVSVCGGACVCVARARADHPASPDRATRYHGVLSAMASNVEHRGLNGRERFQIAVDLVSTRPGGGKGERVRALCSLVEQAGRASALGLALTRIVWPGLAPSSAHGTLSALAAIPHSCGMPCHTAMPYSHATTAGYPATNKPPTCRNRQRTDHRDRQPRRQWRR